VKNAIEVSRLINEALGKTPGATAEAASDETPQAEAPEGSGETPSA